MEYLIYTLTSLVVFFALLLWYYSAPKDNSTPNTKGQEWQPNIDKTFNISEPVYAFVETVKRDRKRFIFEHYHHYKAMCYDTYEEVLYEIYIETHSGFVAQGSEVILNRNYKPSNNIEFLTRCECEYLIYSIDNYFHEIEQRVKRIENIRKRKKLCEVYCE